MWKINKHMYKENYWSGYQGEGGWEVGTKGEGAHLEDDRQIVMYN